MHGDPRSQRFVSNTLQARRLARPPSRENLKKVLRDHGGSAKPTFNQQHPPGSRARPSSLQGEPEEVTGAFG